MISILSTAFLSTLAQIVASTSDDKEFLRADYFKDNNKSVSIYIIPVVN